MSNRLEHFTRMLWAITGAPKILKDTISAALAITTANKVSDERIIKRLEICGACEYCVVKSDSLMCGICGCELREKHMLLNLAIYEEDTHDPPLWGCKSPGPNGSKWKQQGV